MPGTTTQNGRSSAASDAAFNRRQGNSIQYWTPTWLGLSARFAVSLNEGRTRASEFDPSINPTLWSALLNFELGPFSAHYAYEQHSDYFGTNWVGGSPGATFTNPSSNDDAHQLVAWYTFPTDTRLAVIGEHLAYRTDDTVVGAVNGYQRNAIYGAVQQGIGNQHRVWGAFGAADAGTCTTVGNQPCTTNGLGAHQWSVGYTFSPVKTVDIYASYYEMGNGRSAMYGIYPPVVPVAPGTTGRGFGLGIFYMFDVTWVSGGSDPTDEGAAKSGAAAAD